MCCAARCAAPAADVGKCVSIVRTLQSSRHLSGCTCPQRRVRHAAAPQAPALPAGHVPAPHQRDQRQSCALIQALVFRHPCGRSAEPTGASRTQDSGAPQQPYERISLRFHLPHNFLSANAGDAGGSPEPQPQPPPMPMPTPNEPSEHIRNNGQPEPTPHSDTPQEAAVYQLCSRVRLKCLEDSGCAEQLNSYSTRCRSNSCLQMPFPGYVLRLVHTKIDILYGALKYAEYDVFNDSKLEYSYVSTIAF